MTRPRYYAPPPQVMQQMGPLGMVGELAKKKGMNMAINAAIPGGGFAAEAAQVALPQLFEDGGQVESNWAKMLRQWRELKAATANPELQESMARIKHGLGTKSGQQQVQRAMLPLMYQNMGGLTPGPLGMSDMLQAGKGKDVSKVSYKKTGGDVTDVMEISYHAPLAAKE